jgi:hypothetical protein
LAISSVIEAGIANSVRLITASHGGAVVREGDSDPLRCIGRIEPNVEDTYCFGDSREVGLTGGGCLSHHRSRRSDGVNRRANAVRKCRRLNCPAAI